jgi:hypothetical protein
MRYLYFFLLSVFIVMDLAASERRTRSAGKQADGVSAVAPDAINPVQKIIPERS